MHRGFTNEASQMRKLWRLILIHWPWRYPLRGVMLQYDPVERCMVFKPYWEPDESTGYRERVQFRRWWYEAHDLARADVRGMSLPAKYMAGATVVESKFEDTQRVPFWELTGKDMEKTEWAMPMPKDEKPAETA